MAENSRIGSLDAALQRMLPTTYAYIDLMGVGSAERQYAADYAAHRLDGVRERPAASGYALGPDHAAKLREAVDVCLAEDGHLKP